MILKKPYAFLIKHFKLLHLILTGLMIYLSIKLNFITNLFNNLVKGNDVTLLSLSNKYINVIMYLALFIILIIAFVIWFLMKNKKKPNKYYVALLFYYIFLIIILIIYNSALKTLENTVMTNQVLRIYRDIAFLYPLGQYYFIIVASLRGIGFNIKQFNFSKDIKDLEISEEDSEEIEVNISTNSYKYVRAGRKHLRELKYYFFENKFWILIILGVVLIFSLVFFFINYRIVNNNYSENSFVNAGNYRIRVNRTNVSDKDSYGNIIKKGKKYLIVDMTIKNIYYENISLDTTKFRLFKDDNFYYPINNKNEAFKDLGIPYNEEVLETNTDYNFLLIYEIENEVSTNSLKLKVYDGIDYKLNKVNYINIILNPLTFKDKNIKKIELKDNILLSENTFGDTNLTVESYEIVRNYEYTYKSCDGDVCLQKTSVIYPENSIRNKLVIMDYNLIIDEQSNLYKYINSSLNFFNTFASISYTLNGSNKSIRFNGLLNINNNKIIAEIPNELELAESIELNINTRDLKYVYKLK